MALVVRRYLFRLGALMLVSGMAYAQLPEEYIKLKKCFIYGYEVADMAAIVGFHSEMETYQISWSESLELSGLETEYFQKHPKEAATFYNTNCKSQEKPLNLKHGFIKE